MYIVTLYGSMGRNNVPMVFDQFWIPADNPTVRKMILDSFIDGSETPIYDESLFIDNKQNYYEWEVLADWDEPNFYRLTVDKDKYNLWEISRKSGNAINFVFKE